MTDLLNAKNYVNGEFLTADSQLDVENPATEQVIGSVAQGSVSDVEDAVAVAKAAQISWAEKTASERAGYLHEIAAKLRDQAEEFARCLSREQGKTLELARGEVEFTWQYFDYTAEWARRLEGEIITSDRPGEQIFLFRKPIGVVAGILPWNFPLFLIARKMAPALLTGNTIVFKSSSETPLNAYLFAKLVDETGLPKGVFGLVAGRGSVVGSALSRHKDVGLVSVTGSVPTGAQIMADAATNITKVNLELGGNAPVIVMDDADLDVAVSSVVASRVINTGQVCNCAERVYVQEGIADAFLDRLTNKMQAVQFGDPIASAEAGVALDMGPMVNRAGVKSVSQMVEAAKAAGAELLCGGREAEGVGHHYLPTVLANCTDDMSVMRDEIFGPVLPVRRVADLDEAVALANDSDFGLTSSIFSTNLNTVMKACDKLSFGETYVNREHMEAFQGHHAGVRQSGIGGADGKHGIYDFTHTHVVYMQRH
ncbi:MAG: aldehyde dehydrogenase [Rhodobacteraceae bacterium]|nr:aldehyde dehydrogenase [Paracoccaceae bacterium]